MAEILLFGATGYTGRLTAHALGRRGASFALAGRDRRRLEEVARSTGASDARVAHVGDTESLVRALQGARVLVTCVGPFMSFGDTAVEAALRAGVHYIDSSAEPGFIVRLLRRDADARAAGIAFAPSMGFNSAPPDLATTLSCAALERPSVVLTFLTATSLSVGAMRSLLGVLGSPAWWIRDGRPVEIGMGEEERWAPIPPPVGVKRASSAPMAIARIAPLHLDLDSLETYATIASWQRLAMRPGLVPLRLAWSSPATHRIIETVLARLPEGPGPRARRAPWTILAEARSERGSRNVALTGSDFYGLTGELLAAGAVVMADPGYTQRGVLSPVQAIGLERLQKELIDHDVAIDIFETG